MAKVTAYKDTFDTDGQGEIELSSFLTAVKRGKWKEITDAVKALPTDDPRRNAQKQSLPGITPSGTFAPGKLDEGLIEHSGVICLDVDKDEPHYRQLFEADPYVSDLHRSTTGKGWAVYVKVDKANMDATKHKELALALCTYFKEKYNIDVDPTCKNPSRLRYVAYDPDLYSTPDGKVWCKREEYKKPDLNAVKSDNTLPVEVAIFRTEKVFMQTNGAFGAKGERHEWVMKFLVWLNRAGVPGVDALNYVIANYPIPDRNYVKEHERTAEHVYSKNAAEFGTKTQPSFYDPEDVTRWPQHRKLMLEWYIEGAVKSLKRYIEKTQKPSEAYVEAETNKIKFLEAIWETL